MTSSPHCAQRDVARVLKNSLLPSSPPGMRATQTLRMPIMGAPIMRRRWSALWSKTSAFPSHSPSGHSTTARSGFTHEVPVSLVLNTKTPRPVVSYWRTARASALARQFSASGSFSPRNRGSSPLAAGLPSRSRTRL